ncbi:hypothetical protein Kpol_1032p57 [Vanderwaltozyma polyspora DSM 70294]|uniref:Methionyl-tRNA formyltransferase, mitochondrial n=1 Tax=Vanderwaltozyma polyspora (strain ATCC 22028 / DSM 70294 / BCRC 21397 / CBS 2163 / NBRC 10782 / NRRL Y-8283 / UCD 57-17) TaxID=436907 RepID=A7TH11_VANPO|nr:uncharacterized protein Kpol_1032p57 [Vanderwaltozyma polyspora DSM 70294]EDO18463.1 hypothetical protein Kpol_1032p57 [Vanderwaltozyma polyspora DSM 70294]
MVSLGSLVFAWSKRLNYSGRRYYFHNGKDPLKILFFGSDEFSIHSLRALNDIKSTGSGILDSIQVVTRSPKWCGRGKSILKETPIMHVTDTMGLQNALFCDNKQELISLRDSVDFNMIVAVSFGQLIPPELLEKSSWSMNVHPSLLPKYKGSSPIQYSLLNRDEFTGVSIQTLHPTKFDHGSIICQTPPLNVAELLKKGTVSNFVEETPLKTAILMDQLGIAGGYLLKNIVLKGLYLQDPKTGYQPNPDIKPSYAPRIKSEQRKIHWENDDACTLTNKIGILGPLYTFKEVKLKSKDLLKRIIFHEVKETLERPAQLIYPGDFYYDGSTKLLYVLCSGNTCISISKLQFEGFAVESAESFNSKLRKRCGRDLFEKTLFVN